LANDISLRGIFGRLSGRVLNFLRSYGQREQEFRLQPKGQYAPDSSLFAAYGYNDLAEQMRIESDLQSRYIDYEDMDDYVETANALDAFADESTQPDPETGKTVWIEADVGDIKDKLRFLFERRLKIDEEIWSIARSLCKYGNLFEELITTDDGVMGLYHLPAPSVRRIEKDKGLLLGFIQSITGTSFSLTPPEFEALLADTNRRQGQTDALFEDWQVVHMRFQSRLRHAKYGYGILEPARWVWKRLLLLEDSALIYRLTRAPSRFVFTVDVGQIPRNEVFGALNKYKDLFKKRRLVDPSTGKLTMRFNPLAFDEDFFLPKANGERLAEVETLEGPNYQVMDDVEYFRSKLFAAIKIPKAYMGYDESETKSTLAMQDVNFARVIMRIQREIRNGLKRVGNVHLVALGIDPAAVDWDVSMMIPSAIFELAQLEVRNARAEFADKMEKWVSHYWIMRNVFGYSDEEIEAIAKQRAKEAEGGEAAPEKGGRKKREGEEPQRGMDALRTPTRSLFSSGRRVEPGAIFGANRPRRTVEPLTEEWLFKGRNRDHEKFVEDNFKKLMQRNRTTESRLVEVRGMMHELSLALKSSRKR